MWGVSATLGRAAFTGRLLSSASLQPIDPLILSQSRTTLSFFVLLPVLFLSRGPRRLRLPSADIGRLMLLGVLGVAASNYFYYLAIQRTNVAIAIIVQYTAPVWVLLYMVIRGLQRATAQRVVAVALALTGIVLVIGIVGSGSVRLDTVGVIAAMLAAFSFAFYNVAGHSLLERYDRWTVLLYVTGSTALFWIIVNPPWKIAAAHYSSAEWMFLMVFSLVSVLVPFSLYFAGLQHLEPTRAIVVSCLEPVFSICARGRLRWEKSCVPCRRWELCWCWRRRWWCRCRTGSRQGRWSSRSSKQIRNDGGRRRPPVGCRRCW